MAGMNLTRPAPDTNRYSYKNGEYLIEEDKTEQQGTVTSPTDIMNDEEKRRGQYYSQQYFLRKAEVDKYEDEWAENEKMYACKRDPVSSDPSYPCSFIPLVTPVIEGQVAAINESGVEYTHVTDVPSHRHLMLKLDAASEYCRRMNKSALYFKDYTRTYDLQGNCWLTISWEKGFDKKVTKPEGYAKLSIPPLRTVFCDGRIKDYKDLQFSEYIIHEIGFVPIMWARNEYGDEKAEALAASSTEYQGVDPDMSFDDSKSFTLLHVWTRTNKQGNLQLIEMDTNGFVLRVSNPNKPYYENVGNEYPFWFGRMIPRLGSFYGFGDGAILKYMQETVNRLTDELEMAARYSAQSQIVVDPRAKMDLDQLTSDPSEIAVANNPRENILQLQGTGLNPVVQNMIEFLLREAQRATRFSDVMTGQVQAASATATAVNSQLVQGSVGIKDKKSDIAAAMEWADRYSLKLCLSKWKKPFWVKLMSDYAEFVDPVMAGTAPASMPLSSSSIQNILNTEDSDRKKIPEWEYVLGDNDKPIMQNIDFDVKVVLGNAIPKGRTDFYNILLGLAQLQIVGEDGIPKPLVSGERITELFEQTLGIKLKTEGQRKPQGGVVATQGLNPVGNSGAVQVPTQIPENLFGTMPQQPSGDPRRSVV